MPSLLRNILFHLTNRGLLVLLSLVSTPILVHRLGSEAYGIYVLSLTLGGLLGVLDLGLTPAVVRLLSAALHDQTDGESQAIVSTALTLFLGLGVVGGLLFAALVPWLALQVLRIPPELQAVAQVALWLSTVSFALTMWQAVFNAIPIALERYDILARSLATVSLLATLLTILCAWFSGSLVLLMLVNVVATAAALVVLYLLSRHLLPSLQFRLGFDKPIFRELVRFSAFKFVGSLSSNLVYRLDQFVLGAVLGLQSVSIYAIPSTVSLRVSSLLWEAVGPLFPHVSKLQGSVDTRRRLFLRASRLMALEAVLVQSVMFVLGPALIRLWIRGETGAMIADQSEAAMRFLLAALMIQSLAIVPITYCEALGRPQINNTLSTLAAIVHVPLLLLLVPRLGIAGPSIALLAVGLLFTVPFIVYASKTMAGVGVTDLVRQIIGPASLAALGTMAAGYFLAPTVHSWLTLLLAGALLGLVYLGLSLVLGLLRRDDLAVVLAYADRIPAWVPGGASLRRWRQNADQRAEPL